MNAREAAIRETSRCDECAAPWTHEVNGRRLCGYDAANVLLAELAVAREDRDTWYVIATAARDANDEALDAYEKQLRINAELVQLNAQHIERERLLREALRQIRDYEWHPGQPPTPDVRGIARAALDAAGEQT